MRALRDGRANAFHRRGGCSRLAEVRLLLRLGVAGVTLGLAADARAQAADVSAPAPPASTAPVAPEAPPAQPAAKIEVTETTQPEGSLLPSPIPEDPPMPPRRRGVVIESRLGALAFLGDFRHISPTAPWWHVDVGYEILNWLGVFGYGEVAFTDTSEIQGAALITAFPIYGFGGGARVTLHASRRVAFFGEGNAGAMRADVPKGTLIDQGFGNAEQFSLAVGGRVGVEWYQLDRHLAFGLDVGLRDALGFVQQFSPTGPPLMLDASGAVRYTF